MAIHLNHEALDHAKRLVREGKVSRDERDDWSEHAPTAAEENSFIDDHGFEEFARWHLGEDASENAETKGRYSFPFGDFSRVHRCGVISAESRAAQNDHDTVATAARELLALIDEGGTK
jgi:hypothetical protein